MKQIHEPMKLHFDSSNENLLTGRTRECLSGWLYDDEIELLKKSGKFKKFFRIVKCSKSKKNSIRVLRYIEGYLARTKNDTRIGKTFCNAVFMKATGISLEMNESVNVKAQGVK